MKYIAIFLCVVGLSLAVGYTDWQQGAAEGLNIGFKMGQAYEQAQKGINVSGFNAQVDVYNAWVREHFGEDRLLLMQRMNSAPVDLSKPVMIANNTTTPKGIIHQIDGNNKAGGASYTTNDINLLPDSAIKSYRESETGQKTGDGYLTGG
jgi:hypothetical protein